MGSTKSFLLRGNQNLKIGSTVYTWTPPIGNETVLLGWFGKLLSLVGQSTPARVTGLCVSYCRATKWFITTIQVTKQ